VPIARRQRQLLAAPRESVVPWRQGAARALEGIPTSVKDEDAIRRMARDGGLNAHKRQPGEIPVVDKLLVRAPCCTPRPNGTGVLFHSAGPGARPLGVTRNLRITWANWPHPIRAPPDQPSD
jgi:hypothetical protein